MLRIWRRVKENWPKLPAYEMDVQAVYHSPPHLNAQTVNPNQGYHQLLMILRPESGES
jgi:hypothetical protein